jgi:hypothetical protein
LDVPQIERMIWSNHMNPPTTIALPLLGLFVCVVPLLAHHSVAASYDTSQTTTVTGVITSVEWRNPHVVLHLAVKNNDGNVVNWRLEMRGRVRYQRWVLIQGR